jgi:hypothetical protein
LNSKVEFMLNLPTFILPSADDLFQESSIVHNCLPITQADGIGNGLGLSLNYDII